MSRPELERMASAAAIIRCCRQQLAAQNSDIVSEVTAGAAISDWQHYPLDEVYDPQTHAQYFYHTHPSPAPREHGHFHLFLRAEGMPAGATPLLLPEIAVANVPPQAAPLKRGTRDEVAHILAIAVDRRGEPIRLFTTNRWVTGETWYRAEEVIGMLDRFWIGESAPSPLANRWVGAMLRLFRPQIADLLRARDDTVMAWRRRRRTLVFEDLRLEVTSSLEIDLTAQLGFVDRAHAGAAAIPGPALPPMAEGWGEDPAP